LATVERFEDLEVWIKARELTKLIYEITGKDDFAKDFGLRDQIRRAAASVMSNIAEGFERSGDKEFLRYLSIAKGSAGEVRSQLYVAFDNGFIDDSLCKKLIFLAEEISRMIFGLMSYLQTSKNGIGPK
jgi:four helix bundle protein